MGRRDFSPCLLDFATKIRNKLSLISKTWKKTPRPIRISQYALMQSSSILSQLLLLELQAPDFSRGVVDALLLLISPLFLWLVSKCANIPVSNFA